jgi:hypothetical protein
MPQYHGSGPAAIGRKLSYREIGETGPENEPAAAAK